ncbi:unnamed protein product [Ectocarpus sp. CCAP 1310/34]|nr:unnamed protein product [Ectocarpus sp. CCAP 1310/34]
MPAAEVSFHDEDKLAALFASAGMKQLASRPAHVSGGNKDYSRSAAPASKSWKNRWGDQDSTAKSGTDDRRCSTQSSRGRGVGDSGRGQAVGNEPTRSSPASRHRRSRSRSAERQQRTNPSSRRGRSWSGDRRRRNTPSSRRSRSRSQNRSGGNSRAISTDSSRAGKGGRRSGHGNRQVMNDRGEQRRRDIFESRNMPPRTTRRSTAAASAAASSTTASSAAAPASSAAAAPAAAAAASAAASAPMGPFSPPPSGLPPRPDRQTAAFVDATTAAYALPCYTALVPGAGAMLDLGRVFDRNRLGCDQGSVEELAHRLGEVATRLPPLPGAEVYTAVLARARMVATSRAGDKSVAYRQAEAKKLLAEYIVELALRHGRLLQSEGCVLLEAVEDIVLPAHHGLSAARSAAVVPFAAAAAPAAAPATYISDAELAQRMQTQIDLSGGPGDSSVRVESPNERDDRELIAVLTRAHEKPEVRCSIFHI